MDRGGNAVRTVDRKPGGSGVDVCPPGSRWGELPRPVGWPCTAGPAGHRPQGRAAMFGVRTPGLALEPGSGYRSARTQGLWGVWRVRAPGAPRAADSVIAGVNVPGPESTFPGRGSPKTWRCRRCEPAAGGGRGSAAFRALGRSWPMGGGEVPGPCRVPRVDDDPRRAGARGGGACPATKPVRVQGGRVADPVQRGPLGGGGPFAAGWAAVRRPSTASVGHPGKGWGASAPRARSANPWGSRAGVRRRGGWALPETSGSATRSPTFVCAAVGWVKAVGSWPAAWSISQARVPGPEGTPTAERGRVLFFFGATMGPPLARPTGSRAVIGDPF